MHTAALGLLPDGLLSLPFGAHKEDAAAPPAYISGEIAGFLEFGKGLLKVDYVYSVSGTEDILFHFGVPPFGLMTEVATRLKKFFHGDYSQNR
jgi:hypothetical protein